MRLLLLRDVLATPVLGVSRADLMGSRGDLRGSRGYLAGVKGDLGVSRKT